MIWRTWQPKFEQRDMATHSGIKIILRREQVKRSFNTYRDLGCFQVKDAFQIIIEPFNVPHMASFIASVAIAKLSSKRLNNLPGYCTFLCDLMKLV